MKCLLLYLRTGLGWDVVMKWSPGVVSVLFFVAPVLLSHSNVPLLS